MYNNMLIYYFSLKRILPPLNEYSELETMLAMRKLGASYTVLSEHFNCSRNTIEYLCQKFGLGGSINPPIARTTRIEKKPLYTEEKINQGKTYKEYLQAEKLRKCKNLTQRK